MLKEGRCGSFGRFSVLLPTEPPPPKKHSAPDPHCTALSLPFHTVCLCVCAICPHFSVSLVATLTLELLTYLNASVCVAVVGTESAVAQF